MGLAGLYYCENDCRQQAVADRLHYDQFRAFSAAIGLLGAAAVSTQDIIEGFKRLQTALGYGDDLTITYIVGGALATFSYVVIAITSPGFALSHVPSYWIGGSDLFTLGVLFALLGIAAGRFILGMSSERTQNLIVVALIHGLINAVGVGITLVMLL